MGTVELYKDEGGLIQRVIKGSGRKTVATFSMFNQGEKEKVLRAARPVWQGKSGETDMECALQHSSSTRPLRLNLALAFPPSAEFLVAPKVL